MTHAKVVSFTSRGAALAAQVCGCLENTVAERYDRADSPDLQKTSLTRFAQQAMMDCSLIVFIGAAGIAVRAIAPYLVGKAADPAVLVLDENGRFVIPLLSGHLGGANAYARQLAAALGAQAVITTATDGRGVFAVDEWAREQGFIVAEPGKIRMVSAALLRGERIGFRSERPVEGILPDGLDICGSPVVGVSIGLDMSAAPFECTLHLVPRAVHIGFGCRRGACAAAVEAAASAALAAAGLPPEAICRAATIDRKADEPGLASFCAAHGLALDVFPAEVLAAVPGDFTASAFVEGTVGVDNVGERAAVCSAGCGQLLCQKTVRDGVTAALAAGEWRVSFAAGNGWD